MEKENPFDSADLAQVRAAQEDPWVMYLIVRDDLKMSAGKTAAQAGHAVGMIYEDYISLQKEEKYFLNSLRDKVELAPEKVERWEQLKAQLHAFRSWRSESFRKIVLRADLKEWAKLKLCAELECFVVRDAGLTEVAAGSETVIGLRPMKKSQAPKLIKRLQVYA